MAVLSTRARRRGAHLLPGSGRALPIAFALASLAIAFAQRPGKAYHDTRLELSADPGLFLHRVAALWSPTTDLGHVQSGQWVGYLWPMAPYFSFMRWLGMPTWVSQRLWLALLLTLAAWGAIRVMDELYDRRRGLAHIVAGSLYALNPYVVAYVNRSATLLAYAALPWLIVAARRGLRRPADWRWPAVIGLVVASAGGGLNAALVLWVLVGPAALVLYEVAVLGGRWRDAGAFAWRAAACILGASLWWIVPVALQSRYGADFLAYTEQPRTILVTPSVSESLRLLGFWVEYFPIGTGPAEQASLPGLAPYLFGATTIVGTFAVPVLAFGAATLTRRWVYAPYLILLGGGAVVAMALGFPPGSAVNDGVTWTYYHVPALQFLRTMYKAAPLLALSLACLAGAGTVALIDRLRDPGIRLLGSRLPAWSALILLALPVMWARPLLAGHAVDSEIAYDEIPATWKQAMADVDRTTPRDHRTMVLPGELFAWYRWGGTFDPVGPALARRPVLVRQVDRYAVPRSAQLLASVDDLVQQARLVPGQLDPLLRLLGVGQVLVPTDGRVELDNALDPVGVADALSGQAGFKRAAEEYGPVRRVAPAPAWSGLTLPLPDLRRYRVDDAGPGIVRVHPRQGSVVLDGDAEGVVELAATGSLDPGNALLYAGDLDRAALATRVREGAELVFSDSNRRRRLVAQRVTENHGPTLGDQDPIPQADPRYDPFPGRGAAGRTVAVYSGLRYLRANQTATELTRPQNRPYAAFDGRADTAWLAAALPSDPHYLELALRRPLAVAAIDIRPHFTGASRRGRLGVSVNGGPERIVRVRRGSNRIALPRSRVSTLRVRIVSSEGNLLGGLDGLSEVSVPGLGVRETLRLPTVLATASRGLDLSHNPLAVVLGRTTVDFPYRTGRLVEHARHPNVSDAEPGLVRDVTLPVARTFSVDGWGSVDRRVDDAHIDRLAGLPAGWSFTSSSRFEGLPGRRASSAFDGDPRTAWIGARGTLVRPWLAWRSPRPFRVQRLRLRPGPPEYAFPSRVQVATALGPRQLPVGADGWVRLPGPVVTDNLRLDVVAIRPPAGDLARRRLRAVAVGEVVVPGLDAPHVRRSGAFSTACGDLRITAGRSRADMAVSGTLADLDAGRPLRMAGCGRDARIALAAGRTTLSAPAGNVMRPDHLRLRSPAPQPLAGAAPGLARVVDPGRAHDGRRNHVRLAVAGPSWLVFGESYSSGWRAWCRDRAGHERALGAPVPIDGFANGWRVGQSCREARFAFAPQRTANWSYALSLLAAGAMALFLLVGLVRRRGASEASGPTRDERVLEEPLADPLLRLSWPAALAWAAGAGVAGGLLYGRVVGLGVAAVFVVLGREGLSARRLLAVAAFALAVVPVLYLASPAEVFGGFNFNFGTHYISAHRVAAIAVACILGAGALQVSRLRARR